jgi:hypothetical protein
VLDGTTKIAQAFQSRKSNIQVQSQGRVVAVLKDDNDGTRHQKFIVELPNAMTVLVAHNIDLAPRIERYKEIFRKRKDKYRRWRDLGTFVMIGIYAFSVIDAYVDASLSEFDISDDLSLRIEPTMLNNGNKTANPLRSGSLGVSCSLTF